MFSLVLLFWVLMKSVPAPLTVSAPQIHSLLSGNAVGWVRVLGLASQVRHMCCLHRDKLELKDINVVAKGVLYSFELHLLELSGLAVRTEAFSKAWGLSVLQFLLCCYGGMAVDRYQQHLKIWRKGYKAFRVVSPGSGPQWGRVHIIAVTLAVLWSVVNLSVWHCRRLQTESWLPVVLWFSVLLSAWSWYFGKVTDENDSTLSWIMAKEKMKSIFLPFLGPKYIMEIFILKGQMQRETMSSTCLSFSLSLARWDSLKVRVEVSHSH